jgi:hypothetical protein
MCYRLKSRVLPASQGGLNKWYHQLSKMFERKPLDLDGSRAIILISRVLHIFFPYILNGADDLFRRHQRFRFHADLGTSIALLGGNHECHLLSIVFYVNMYVYICQEYRRHITDRKTADMEALRETLGGCSRRSVFRYLDRIGYLSSFTYAGRYYTLESIAKFDEQGLWFHYDIGFSRSGTLKETTAVQVEKTPEGSHA